MQMHTNTSSFWATIYLHLNNNKKKKWKNQQSAVIHENNSRKEAENVSQVMHVPVQTLDDFPANLTTHEAKDVLTTTKNTKPSIDFHCLNAPLDAYMGFHITTTKS